MQTPNSQRGAASPRDNDRDYSEDREDKDLGDDDKDLGDDDKDLGDDKDVKETPKASPKVTTPKASPKASPVTTPKASPKATSPISKATEQTPKVHICTYMLMTQFFSLKNGEKLECPTHGVFYTHSSDTGIQTCWTLDRHGRYTDQIECPDCAKVMGSPAKYPMNSDATSMEVECCA